MPGRLHLSAFLLLALVVIAVVGCAGSTPSTPSVQIPITSASEVAGKWAGTVRRDPSNEDDWVDMTIRDDGTYDIKSFRTVGAALGGGRLTVSGGKLVAETERARTTYTLYEREGKRTLNVDGVLKNGVPFSASLTPAK